jgi:hypothetical protein
LLDLFSLVSQDLGYCVDINNIEKNICINYVLLPHIKGSSAV